MYKKNNMALKLFAHVKKQKNWLKNWDARIFKKLSSWLPNRLIIFGFNHTNKS